MTELDPEARQLLSLARTARTPSSADKRRIERRLAVTVGAAALAATAPAIVQASAASSFAEAGALFASTKLWLTSGILLVSAAGMYTVATRTGLPARHPQPSAATTNAPVAPPLPAIQVEAAPAPSPIAVGERPAPEPTRNALAPARPDRRRVNTLNRELDLLHEAQSAWRARDASGALSILDEHERRYPRSELRLERGTLRALSLCELGREREANKVSRELRRAAPNSPLRAALEESCVSPRE